jgi:N-acetylglucosaminyldiphosphoundecaprenol N-acetyl-beta-D-mannosaminyltransferase
MLSPPFKDEFDEADDAAMIAAVNAARPDVLWVGMTAPKQEKWIYRNHDRLDVPFTGAIGAAFDFYAGTKKRAPQWVGQMGLEWLPRLVREPRRLWRRNLVSTPKFLYKVLAQVVFQMGRSGN